jgi:hypothetical protein
MSPRSLFGKELFLFLLLILVAVGGSSQTWRPDMSLFSYGDSVLSRKGYKAAVDSLLAVEKKFISESSGPQAKSIHYQAMMTFYSFLGDNFRSISYEEKAFPFTQAIDAGLLQEAYEIRDAGEYIIKCFGQERVILLNEAHNRGQNRAFLRSLLPALHRSGFRNIALEALSNGDKADTLLAKRGYPVKATGYYIREPAFAQLIRDALSQGFRFVPYEDTAGTFRGNPVMREQAQAENIFRFLESNPVEKLIVLAGHDHIHKKQGSSAFPRMAEILCKLSGLDIPSIDCISLKEKNTRNYESTFYRYLADTLKITKPSVILHRDTPFTAPRYRGQVNLSVYLPRTDYSLYYPDWLKESGDTFFDLVLQTDTSLAGSLLQVYRATEWDDERSEAIPVIQLTLPEKRKEFRLYLKKGRYYVFVCGDNDRILFKKDFQIE